MIELYLGGYKADIDKDIDISLTFESIDTTSPQAIKNSFSKSVVLKGTKTNNKLFGEIYKLDREVLDDGLVGGIHFDANKRTEFKLYNNAELIESGYFQLDEINRNGNVVEYSVTLYGSLGDFFYNLSTREDGEKMKLSDLVFNSTWLSDRHFEWNARQINSLWNELYNYGGADLTVVPTYSGFYDDFDNDKVLVNYRDLNSTIAGAIGSAITDSRGEVIGTPLNNFGIVELDRELDEWEVKDFRSNFQRPAIKNEIILNAIADPQNNGGYTLIYSEALQKSPYFHNTYFLQKRINPENITSSDIQFDFGGYVFNSNLQGELIGISNAYPTWLNKTWTKQVEGLTYQYWLMREDGVTEITVDEELKNNFTTLNVPLTIEYDGVPSSKDFDNASTVGYTTNKRYLREGEGFNTAFVVAGIWVKFHFYINNTIVDTKYYYVLSDMDNIRGSDRHGNFEKIFEVMKVDNDNKDFVIENFSLIRDGATKMKMIAPFELNYREQLKGTTVGDKIRVKVELINSTYFRFFYDSHQNRYYDGTAHFGWTDAQIFGGSFHDNERCGQRGLKMSVSKNENIPMGFVSQEGSTVQTMMVSKSDIINTDKSPFEYLIGFAKMLNLRFEVAKDLKEIRLMMPWEYYKDEVVDIHKLIDRGSDITITPHIADTQYYSYCLPTPETYASSIVKKKTGKEYGEYVKNTGYNFEKDTTDVLEDNIFTNLVPYRLNSAFFTNVTRDDVLLPSWLNCGSYKLNLASTTTNEGVSEDKVGLGGEYSKPLNKSYDGWSKLCAFDSDNNTVDDATDCLVFFDDYWIVVGDKDYSLSDNLLYMLDINDGTPCHIYSKTGVLSNSPYSQDYYHRYIDLFRLPRFTKNIQGYSLDMFTPEMSFDNINFIAGEDIYSKFFAPEVNDLYNKNAKRVECSVFLPDTPQEALKKFYYFNNSLWILTKINDYTPISSEPVRCEFVKIVDKRSYLGSAVGEETTTTTTDAPVSTTTTTTTSTTTTTEPPTVSTTTTTTTSTTTTTEPPTTTTTTTSTEPPTTTTTTTTTSTTTTTKAPDSSSYSGGGVTLNLSKLNATRGSLNKMLNSNSSAGFWLNGTKDNPFGYYD